MSFSLRSSSSCLFFVCVQLLLATTNACGPSEAHGPMGRGGTASAAGRSSSGGESATGGRSANGGNTVTGGQAVVETGGAGGDGGAADTVDAVAMAKAMGFGTNLGNTFDNTTSWETGWGQPLVTQAFINGIASRGIKTVRVPVAWDTYAKNGTIDSAKLDRVKQVVGFIEAAGMYAIVNIHWDGGWIFNENKTNAYRLTEDVKTKFASYWKQLGSGFSQVGHKLILEALNEEARFFVNGDPNGTPDMAPVNELNQLFVSTVRAQGGENATRALLIAGFQTDIAKTCVNAFTIPSDPAGKGKLFLSIHFYDPFPFTLMEDPASWGSPSATWGTDAERKSLEDSFETLGSCSQQKRVPVILGEFGVTKGQKVVRQSSSRILWMQSVAKASFSRGIVPVLWDTNTDIDRSDGSFSSDLQAVMNGLK
jgi:endoglucanase